jgi:two-component system response regulator NreC
MISKNSIRVLCVDDHEFLSEGLAARLALERDMECVGRLNNAENLVDEVRRTRADVVLLDLEMPGPDPLERLPDLARQAPDAKVVILSAHVRDSYIDAALQRGASGYFAKTDPPAAIFEGVRQVAAGGQAFGKDITERLERAAASGQHSESKLRTLSPREMEVLRLIGRGMSRADIARQLFRSLKTIDAHHTSIMRKLDIHDRAELTRYAIREGLVEA